MLKQIKIGFFALAAFALLASCKNDQDGAATDAAVQSAAGTDATAAAGTDATATPQPTGLAAQDPNAAGQPVSPTTAPPATAPAPTGPTTTVEFAETTYDFGKVKAPEKVRHTFKFKNTGKEPLIISSAKPSCGCTVPKWPQEPIAPGKSGEITVEFDSKGKSGQTSKNVTVTANTDPPQTMLYFKADIQGEAGAAQGH